MHKDAKKFHGPEDALVGKFLEDPLNKVICPKRAQTYRPVADCAAVKELTPGYPEKVGAPCPHLMAFMDMDRGEGAPVDIRPFCNHPYPLRVHRIG